MDLPSTHLPALLSSDSIGTTPSRLTERERHAIDAMNPLAPLRL
jgi:hypothetical protein